VLLQKSVVLLLSTLDIAPSLIQLKLHSLLVYGFLSTFQARETDQQHSSLLDTSCL